MASNYKDNFDYAEAIANTQDAGERQQLLAERQNKIEAEGLAGKVASNEAVSTWNGAYRPYSVSSHANGGRQRGEPTIRRSRKRAPATLGGSPCTHPAAASEEPVRD